MCETICENSLKAENILSGKIHPPPPIVFLLNLINSLSPKPFRKNPLGAFLLHGSIEEFVYFFPPGHYVLNINLNETEGIFSPLLPQKNTKQCF